MSYPFDYGLIILLEVLYSNFREVGNHFIKLGLLPDKDFNGYKYAWKKSVQNI